MPLEFAERPEAEQRKSVREIYENYGNRTREFRNGLGLAVPSSGQIELLRQAVRYSLAIERVQGKWREFNLTDAQRDQLKERKATEQSATESALLRLYGEVWLPKSDNGSLSLEAISIGGRPLQITLDEKKRAQIHQSLMDLLVTPQRWVFASVAPGKIVGLFKLGERDSADLGIATNKVVAGFFSFLDFPRLLSSDMVRRAIARGVQTGVFGYATGSPALGDDRRYQIDWSRVAFERNVAVDEIDLDSGFLIIPRALPEKLVEPTDTQNGVETGMCESGETGTGAGGETSGTDEGSSVTDEDEREVALSFVADRTNLYGAWKALANLADIAGEVSIRISATP